MTPKVSSNRIVKTLTLEYPRYINFDQWMNYVQRPVSERGLGFRVSGCSVVHMGDDGTEPVHIMVTFRESILPYHPRIFTFNGVVPVITELNSE